MGCVLGVDYGDKRVGLAISGPDQLLAVVKGLIDNQGADFLIEELGTIIEESRVEKVVFGLPLHLSGEESESSMKVRDFAALLHDKLKIPIAFEDERFTTTQSIRPLMMEKKKHRQKKGLRDQGAAVLILQAHLDRGVRELGS